MMKQELIYCKCNCGNLKNRYTKNGIETFYIRNHNKRKEGGIMHYKTGHIGIKKRNHPYCNNGGYVMAHRLVYEEYMTKKWGIRFIIHPSLHVHHIDRNPQNNNIENLLLLTNSQHRFLHNEEYRLKYIINRKCIECNVDYSRKWLKTDNGYKCKNCYERKRRRNKKLLLTST